MIKKKATIVGYFFFLYSSLDDNNYTSTSLPCTSFTIIFFRAAVLLPIPYIIF